jgi:hypothetical protein
MANPLDWSTLLGRVNRWLGSLQVAVILLPLFALVLFLGTLIESWHDRRTAHQLVYGSWWFTGLLGLLGANVVCAALKKRPWKRHQTGFLITHLGLITLVVSGLLTALGGTSGVLVMVDSAEEQFRAFGLHSTDFAIDRDRQVIRVRRSGEIVELQKDFTPAAFRWGEAVEAPDINGLTRCLSFLAHPWPRSWSTTLDENSRLEVLAYHPHTREVAFAPAEDRSSSGVSAIQLQLASEKTGVLAPRWIHLTPGRRHEPLRLGGGQVEYLGSELPVDELKRFQLSATAESGPIPSRRDPSVLGVLQFASGVDGRLAYRTFTRTGDTLTIEKQGEARPGDHWAPIWAGMGFRMRIVQFLPRAAMGPLFIPVDQKPAREEEAQPAIRCRLWRKGQPLDFWLGKTDGGMTPVGELGIGYNSTLRKLGFELRLLRAEQTMDPGSKMPASQSSRVWLRDDAGGINEECLIRLNEPLEHAGYTIYQTGYSQVGTDSRGQPVGRSLLTVTSDPGLSLKYAGSAMVALGIFCMFYMRAYFFGRPAATGQQRQ